MRGSQSFFNHGALNCSKYYSVNPFAKHDQFFFTNYCKLKTFFCFGHHSDSILLETKNPNPNLLKDQKKVSTLICERISAVNASWIKTMNFFYSLQNLM